ncbi:MAG TPA: hypothetical protein DCP53_07260 [Elusimicrobia bacterium]|nr:MAG: hypothetical protein A2551_02055 [Elusimicrobia bacterium RIFOXYD2_FULL_34_30]HAM39172.1 hypothetical protein [Elusimicrobiota bacterium]
MIIKTKVNTTARTEFVNITDILQKLISKQKISDGTCIVFVPHTTAAITINENADPDVVKDILMMLDRKIPLRDSNYEHSEGNSSAHIKASVIGSSVIIIIENGKLKLGTWQGIYFCEFDGPRTREFWLKLI